MQSIFLLMFAVAATLNSLYGQPSQRVVSAPAVESSSNLPAQKIGNDDLVGVFVYDAPELTRNVRVNSDGAIHLPMLKRNIAAAGLMPKDLEVSIADALRTEQILVDPVVTVSVVEYRSRPISVVGAVRHPITFQATGKMSLLDAISRADGLADDAGPEILVSRTQPGLDGRPATITRRIPMKLLINGADPEMNLSLEGGEEIRVPDAGRVYVVGNVKKPGAFSVRDSSETSVLRMLALSEGVLPFASNLAYIYRREGSSSGKNEIPIDLKGIIERKAPDVPLLPNDVLYIPDNASRRKTMTAIDRILTFGAGTASGMLVWRGR